MEKYGLIHAISYNNSVYTFTKGAHPAGYNKEDIKITKRKLYDAREVIPESKAKAMSAEYGYLYYLGKKAYPAYTVQKHRELHYERIYGRKYI